MIWVKKRLKAVPLIPSLCRWLWNRSSLVRCSDCAGVQPPGCVLKDCSSCVVVSPRPLEILITRSVFFITLVLVICSPTCHTTHLAASDNWQGRCRSPDAQWRVIWAFGCSFLQFRPYVTLITIVLIADNRTLYYTPWPLTTSRPAPHRLTPS